MSTDNILFQDIFDIKDLDPQGKRFDRGKLGFFFNSKKKDIKRLIRYNLSP